MLTMRLISTVSVRGVDRRRIAECVDDAHAVVGDAVVRTVDAALRTVTPTLSPVRIVQHLGRQSRQHRAGLRLEDEAGNSRAVLSEVDDQRLARLHDVGSARNREVFAQHDLGPCRRQDLALELVIALAAGGREIPLAARGIRETRVILLATEDSRVRDRTRHRAVPLVRLRADEFRRAVGVSELNDAAKRALLSGIEDDLVAPPARAHLGGKAVHRARIKLDQRREVIGEGTPRLLHMGEARLQRVIAHTKAIQIKVVDTESGGHPLRGLHHLLVGDVAPEDARAIRRALQFLLALARNRSALHRNPLRAVPRRRLQRRDPQCIKAYATARLLHPGAPDKHHASHHQQ